MKRQLVHMANDAFKDARKAKRWLQASNDDLDGDAPIKAIVKDGVNPENIVRVLNKQSRL
jgi:hypothetical protein